MAEIRKFDPSSGEGLGKLVRDALGETVRPNHPSDFVTPPAYLPDDADEEGGTAREEEFDELADVAIDPQFLTYRQPDE